MVVSAPVEEPAHLLLDSIEDDILQLAAEVAFCKKEVGILHTEQATIETVATTQCADI